MKNGLKKNWLILIIFLFLFNVNVNIKTTSVNAALNNDYTNLTFDAGDSSIPSGYFYDGNSGNEAKINTSLSDFSTVILITDGGNSVFPYENNQSNKWKRYMGFTLYEDVELEIGLYSTSNSKNFIIADDSGEVTRKTTEKKVVVPFIYTFKNIPSSGKNFYFGGSNSSVYATYIHWSEAIPKVYFDANGGTFKDGSTRMHITSANAETGDYINDIPETPTHSSNREFLGWATTKDATIANANKFAIGSTYYAVWGEEQITKIDIIYNNSAVSSITLKEGSFTLLKYNTTPSSGSEGEINWYSSDESIVSVTNNGYITATGKGKATITVTALGGKVSDSIEVNVVESKKCTVTFNADGVKKDVVVYENNFVEVPSYYQNIKGYEIEWYYNDKLFNVETTKINQDMELVGKLISNGYATDVKIYKIYNDNTKELCSYDEQINAREVKQFEYELYRSDGEAVTVKDPVVWHSNNQTTLEIDQTTGVITPKLMGKTQIYLTIYSERNKNAFSSSYITVIFTEKIVDGNLIDTTINLKADKGYFQAGSEDEYAARFIAIISEEYVRYIASAKMEITATDYLGNEINRYSVDITNFYRKIEYQSKTPKNYTFKKTWEQENMVGAAVTINNIPYYSFTGGTLKAKFSIIDEDTKMEIYVIKELIY